MLFNKQIWVIPALIMTLLGCVTVKAETDGDSLAGRTWLAEDIDGKGVIDKLQTTIEFAEEGKVMGNAGCNRYFGSASIDGRTIEFGSLGSTRKMCHESIMNQEMAFMQALDIVKRWDMKNGLLFMYAGGEEAVLRFSEIEKK